MDNQTGKKIKIRIKNLGSVINSMYFEKIYRNPCHTEYKVAYLPYFRKVECEVFEALISVSKPKSIQCKK